eukprot:6324146-Prymnesium_polylepis.2
MNSTIRCGVKISGLAADATEADRTEAAAEDAEAAQVAPELEDPASAALWYHDGGDAAWDGADAEVTQGEDANDELATALGADKKTVDTSGFGYSQ